MNRTALGVTCGVVAGLTVIGVWPAAGRLTPPCPFHAVTGLDCPGCGMTRAVKALLRGDIAAAIGFNALGVFLLLPLLAITWWAWIRHRPVPGLLSNNVFMPLLLVVVGLFTVARNVPIGPLDALAA